jgi:hypothetical protein
LFFNLDTDGKLNDKTSFFKPSTFEQNKRCYGVSAVWMGFKEIIAVSLSNFKVSFMHNVCSSYSAKTSPPKGSNLKGGEPYRVGTTAYEEAATRRCPIRPTIKSRLAIKKDAYQKSGRLYGPRSFRGSNPGLICIRQKYCNIRSRLCQYVLASWPNKRLERDVLPRRFFCALNSTKKSPLQQAPQPKR